VANHIEKEEVLAHLARIVSSPVFAGSDRHSRFLTYVVERTLAGDVDSLKEYAIALEVFGRDASYNPKVHSTVRVEATKLRDRLARYYSGPGAHEPIQIEIPKGHYTAHFKRVDRNAAVSPRRHEPQPRRRFLQICALGGTVAVGATAAYLGTNRSRDVRAGVEILVPEAAERGGSSFAAESLGRDLARALQDQGIPERPDSELRVLVTSARCWENPDKLRILAEIRAAGGHVRMWSGKWTDVISRGSQLALQAANSIAEARDLLQPAWRTSTRRTEAMQSFHLANTALRPFEKDWVQQSTSEQNERALLASLLDASRHLEQALQQDPSFAEAAGRLAWVYRLAAEYDHTLSARARAMVTRALELDAAAPEPNFVQGYFRLFEDWSPGLAEQSFERVLHRAVLHVDTYRFYVDVTSIRGRPDLGEARLAEALSAFPRHGPLRYAAMSLAAAAENAGELERLALENLRWNANDLTAAVMLGRSLALQGKRQEAEAQYHRVLLQDPRNIRARTSLARLWAEQGKAKQARNLLADLSNRMPSTLGVIEAILKNDQSAADYFAKAAEVHDNNLLYVGLDPAVRRLRGAPRLDAILRRFQG
jgi:Tfp pilus assembly protein PilF